MMFRKKNGLITQKGLLFENDKHVIDGYLLDKGFPKKELINIRESVIDTYSKLILAGETFKVIGWNNFSLVDLIAVVAPGELKRGGRAPTIQALRELVYNVDSEDLLVNNPTLFRIMTDNYEGNLLDAKKVWKNFKVGRKDWKENIKIPLTIDRKISQFLGVTWVEATTYNNGTKNLRTTFEGNAEDTDLYSSYLIPTLKEIFNYETTLFKSNYSKVYMNSTAINTWLLEDLNYDTTVGKIKRVLPKLDFSNAEIRRGFLEGVIAGKGRLDFISVPILYFPDKNSLINDSIAQFLNMENIPFKRNGVRIYLNSRETAQVAYTYDLLNPKHLEKRIQMYGE